MLRVGLSQHCDSSNESSGNAETVGVSHELNQIKVLRETAGLGYGIFVSLRRQICISLDGVKLACIIFSALLIITVENIPASMSK